MDNPLICLIIALVVAVYMSGCTQAPEIADENQYIPIHSPENLEPVESNGPGLPNSFGEEIAMHQNRTNSSTPEDLIIGETTEISLKENPTTGYTWNVSVTDGLVIVDDTFIGPDDKRVVGAGGTHVWRIKATDVGSQFFSGVYRRSWEPPGDDDTRYSKEFNVHQ
ncbi:MAG: protease inhibitor I42 family protein [Methanomicrobiales archaeon]|nr:protease inhibitor I42 family protein [Methanomicrobiales archaeon]